MRGIADTGVRRAVVGLLLALALIAPGRAFAQDSELADLLARGDQRYAKGDYRGAAALYDRAIASQPKDITAAAYAKRASIFLLEKRYQAGVSWIESVADKVHADDLAVTEQKALLLWHVPGKRGPAVLLAERVLSERPKQLALLLMVGDYHLRSRQQPARAARAFTRYLLYRSEAGAKPDKRVHGKLGFAHLLAGKYDAALHFFRLTLETPGDPRLDILARRGLCAASAEKGDAAAAVPLCERADREARDDRPTIRHLGRAYLAVGRHKSALAAASRLATLEPRKASSHVLLGDILVAAGKDDAARKRYLRAGELGDDNAAAIGLATISTNAGDWNEAARQLRSVAHSSSDPQLLSHLAYAAHRAGDRDALAIAERAFGLSPAGDDRVRVLVVIGVEGQRPDELAQAATLASDAELAAYSRTALVDLGNRLALQVAGEGKPNQAAKTLDRVLTVVPDDWRTMRNRAVLGIELGDAAAVDRTLPQNRIAQLTGDQRALAALLLHRAHRLPPAAEDRDTIEFAVDPAELLTSAIETARDPALVAELRAELGAWHLTVGDSESAVKELGEVDLRAAPPGVAESATRDLVTALCADTASKRIVANYKAAAKLGIELPAGCRFVMAAALYRAGRSKDADALTKGLTAGPWLKNAYATAGIGLLRGYGDYAGGNTSGAIKALTPLAKGTGPAAEQAKRLLGAAHWKRGVTAGGKAALTHLDRAKPLAAPADRARLAADRAAIRLDRAALAAATRQVPAAAANLGIVEANRGKHDEALKLWKEAWQRGVRDSELRSWIRDAEELRSK